MSLRVPYVITAEKDRASGRLLPPSYSLYPELRSVAQARAAVGKDQREVIVGSGYLQMPQRGLGGSRTSSKKALAVLINQLQLDEATNAREFCWILSRWLEQALAQGRSIERKSQTLKIARHMPPLPKRR